ncbi:hypothetical protein [Streptomyces olivaceoviridis]|uniref:hypothetical protein n=1 Tax=Streptomyces olivaceoviridis TaxID=1921 RepID=UPI0036FA4A29
MSETTRNSTAASVLRGRRLNRFRSALTGLIGSPASRPVLPQLPITLENAVDRVDDLVLMCVRRFIDECRPASTDLATHAAAGVAERSRASVAESRDARMRCGVPRSAGEGMAEAPMEEFLERRGVGKDSVFRQDLHESMLIGYGVGNDRENQQGNDPETG